MFSSTIALKDADGTSANYVQIEPIGPGTTRINTGTTLSEPGLLQIRHSASKSASVTIDRHNVLLSLNDKVDGEPDVGPASVSVTIAVPRDPRYTLAVMADLVARAVHLVAGVEFSGGSPMVTTTLEQLMRGEA